LAHGEVITDPESTRLSRHRNALRSTHKESRHGWTADRTGAAVGAVTQDFGLIQAPMPQLLSAFEDWQRSFGVNFMRT
jgi:hypothetical protein